MLKRPISGFLTPGSETTNAFHRFKRSRSDPIGRNGSPRVKLCRAIDSPFQFVDVASDSSPVRDGALPSAAAADETVCIAPVISKGPCRVDWRRELLQRTAGTSERGHRRARIVFLRSLTPRERSSFDRGGATCSWEAATYSWFALR